MKILYFAPIPYHGLRQRPQYLADGLAKEHDVIYVEPTISWLKYVIKGGTKPGRTLHIEPSGVKVLQLNGTYLLPRFVEGIWSGFGFLERMQLRSLIKSADAIWIGFEPWFDLMKDFPEKVIYDKMDDNASITQNPLMRRLICRTAPQLLKRADVLFVSAQQFYDEANEKGLHPVLVPNAVDICQSQTDAPIFEKEAGTKVFGYIGVLAHWFDLEAIRIILDASPMNRVVLVGPEEIERVNDSRIRYIGSVPKSQVGAWIDSFDVCVYPFQRSSLLDTINPVKIYEYLAKNKPVIAVKSKETEHFASKLQLYSNMDQLKQLAATAIDTPFKTEEERKEFIQKNSWEQRTNIVLKQLKAEEIQEKNFTFG